MTHHEFFALVDELIFFLLPSSKHHSTIPSVQIQMNSKDQIDLILVYDPCFHKFCKPWQNFHVIQVLNDVLMFFKHSFHINIHQTSMSNLASFKHLWLLHKSLEGHSHSNFLKWTISKLNSSINNNHCASLALGLGLSTRYMNALWSITTLVS